MMMVILVWMVIMVMMMLQMVVIMVMVTAIPRMPVGLGVTEKLESWAVAPRIHPPPRFDCRSHRSSAHLFCWKSGVPAWGLHWMVEEIRHLPERQFPNN